MPLAANAEDRSNPAPSPAYTPPVASANEPFWQDFSASLNGYAMSGASQTYADLKIDTSAFGYKIVFPDSDPGNSVTIPSERSPWFLTANRFGYNFDFPGSYTPLGAATNSAPASISRSAIIGP